MSNLTISIDDATLKKARLRALSEGVSVNQLLRRFLESYAGANAEQVSAVEDLIALSRRVKSGHKKGPRWTRDELYERK